MPDQGRRRILPETELRFGNRREQILAEPTV
jgi:hypothetical protein